MNTIAIGNGDFGVGGPNDGNRVTDAIGTNSIAFGGNSQAVGVGAVTFGNGTTATPDGSIALGFLSQADRAGLNGAHEAFSGTAVTSPYGALSIGTVGGERQIENVAGGTQDTDAVNVRQLRTVGNNAATALGGGSGYDATTNAYTAPQYTVGGQTYNNVGAAMAAANNLAVQYTPNNAGAATNVVDLTKGGALAPVSVTGLAPATTASGAVSLSQLPLQYSTHAAPTTATQAESNDVTLIGTGGNPVTIHNVATGALNATSTDAVDGQQLYATNQNEATDATNIANLRSGLDNGTEGLVQQNPATQAITVGAATGGTIVDFTNSAGTARTLTGVAAGNLTATSTDATNGSQLYSTNEQVDSLEAGTAGLVQQNPATRNLTVGALTDGTNVDLTNVNGATRSLSGVTAGTLSATSTQAVNGSQLYATNQTIAGLESGSLGLVQQNTTTGDITVGANTNGTDVNFANSAGTARTLSNVAAGQIAAGSTQAINGGQAYNTANSVANNFGGGSVVNPDGTISAPSYTVQGATYNNVGGAIGGLDSAVNTINTRGSKYFAVNSTGAAANAVGTDTVAIGPNSTATASQGVALGANSVASRAGLNGAEEMFSDTSVASTAGAVSVGAAGAERQITNVAGGTAPTDAVNVRQLTASDTQFATALGGGASLNTDGTLHAPSYSVDGKQYADVGSAVTALDSTGVKYDVDSTGAKTNSISLQGGDPNQPVLIKNVATGQAASDAANTGQVATAKAQAMAYTDTNIAAVEGQLGGVNNQLASLQSQVDQNRREARQGAAIGLAAASLRYDDKPGKISTSIGGGLWKGEYATAMGFGYSLPNGWARLSANGVTTGRDFGVGAGASFTLN